MPRSSLTKYILPDYWASYLMNNDPSGLEDADKEECDVWLTINKPGDLVDVADDSHFAGSHDGKKNEGATVCTFTFRKQPTPKEMRGCISQARAKVICSHWHGGMESALYQYSSSGEYYMGNALWYLMEIETCLHPEYAVHPHTLTKTNRMQLNRLKRYFIKEGSKVGLSFVYRVHKTYGYAIPYLNEYTPASLAAKVQQIIRPV